MDERIFTGRRKLIGGDPDELSTSCKNFVNFGLMPLRSFSALAGSGWVHMGKMLTVLVFKVICKVAVA